MLKDVDIPTTVALIALANHLAPNGGPIHIAPIKVCDGCGVVDGARKESGGEYWVFPYSVRGADGRMYEHLCNPCYDRLGCMYEDDDE